MTEYVNIERWKKSKYIVNVPNETGFPRAIIWNLPVGKRPSVTKVPMEIYEWIIANTKAFDVGELRIADTQTVEKEELVDIINDKESYIANAKTNDEIVSILTKSKLPQLKKELSNITEKSTMQQVRNIFEEIKSELVGSKIEIVNEWLKENNLEVE